MFMYVLCVCVCVYVCVLYTYIYTHTHTNTYIHTYIHTYMHMENEDTYVVVVYSSIRLYTPAYVSVCVCVCAYTYEDTLYMRTHIVS
jgi:hypothetical protein